MHFGIEISCNATSEHVIKGVVKQRKLVMDRQHSRTEDELAGATTGHTGVRSVSPNAFINASRGHSRPTAFGWPNIGTTSLYSLTNAPSTKIQLAGEDLPVGLLLDALIHAGVMSKKQLMTTEELAELIRMKPQTIAKWRSAGIADPPPAIHLGRQVRYDAEEVMDWIYRNRL
jgi:predicted DNA-binding transcriptional regulator AlpA